MHNYVINLCIVIGVLTTPWAYQSTACPVLINNNNNNLRPRFQLVADPSTIGLLVARL